MSQSASTTADLSAALAEAALLRRITGIETLVELLDMLAEAVTAVGGIDGFLVFLPNRDGSYLRCHKILLPSGYLGMQDAYIGWKYRIEGGTVLGDCYLGGRTVDVTPEVLAADEELRGRFQRWRLKGCSLLPIADEGGAPVGVFQALSVGGPVSAETVDALARVLRVFARPIHHEIVSHELREQQARIEAAAAQQEQLFGFIDSVSQLASSELIYDLICEELLRRFPFDACNIALRRGDEVVVKKTYLGNPAFAERYAPYAEFLLHQRYPLTADGGALPVIFLKNVRFLIPDVSLIMHLPMAEADRRAIEMLGGYRTALFVPVRQRGQVRGVVQLVTLGEPVTIPEADLQVLDAMCSYVGTAIVNAELYTTVEQQKEDIRTTQQALVEAERRRAEAAAAAQEAAEMAAQQKSAFLANMSHEIRTPLTAIIGYGESLLDNTLSASERNQFAATIIRNGHHLLNLLNDILDFSKIEAGKLEVEHVPVDLPPLLYDLQAMFEPRARAKGLEFRLRLDTRVPRRIVSDPTRLRQILINLLGNALKFTHRGSIELALSWRPEAGQLAIAVIDTGIGMSETHQERIFEAFIQADTSTSRRYGGTGLGLSISKQLAVSLGGTLTVASRVGEGSRFELSVATGPLDEPELLEVDPAMLARGASLPVTRTPRLRGRILCAEDNRDNQRLITRLVKQTGAEVALAENGRIAVEMALSEHFDLILMDIQMPVLSGLDALLRLRARGYERPVVAVTANVMPEDVRRYQEAGFDAHLAKPLRREALYETLSLYLGAIGGEPDAPSCPDVRGHILVAEDNPDSQLLVRRYLEATGAQVTVVADGQAAVETALSNEFDLVFMDLEMPRVGGLEAVRLLRNCGFGKPIYLFSAENDPAIIETARLAGCDGHVAKPFDLERLFDAVSRHLQPAVAADADLTGLDQGQMEDLVALFVGRLPEMLTQMRGAMVQQDWKELGGLAHQLKGTGAAFGYPQLTTLSETLGEAIRRGDAGEISESWRQLEEETLRAMQPG